jgi:hypothetical protein
MELFRYSRDAYGQETLQGISFDLVWVFIGISAAIIVGHAIYKIFLNKAQQ